MQKKKSRALLISVILSVLWMIFSSVTLSSTLDDGLSGSVGTQIGTLIGSVLIMPYIIVAWIGTIFNCVGYFTYRRGFVLTAAILFCVSLVLMFMWGFGLIPSIILSFVAYAKMNKPAEENIESM